MLCAVLCSCCRCGKSLRSPLFGQRSASRMALAGARLGTARGALSCAECSLFFTFAHRIGQPSAHRSSGEQPEAQGHHRGFYQDHPELASVGGKENRLLTAYSTFLEAEKAVDDVHRRFDRQLGAQHAWIRVLQFISPAVIYRDALAAAAGTDHSGMLTFRRDVERFQQQVRAFLLSKAWASSNPTLADYDRVSIFAASAAGLPLPWASIAGILLLSALLLLLVWRRSRFTESIFLKG